MSEDIHEQTGRRQSDDIIIKLEQQVGDVLQAVGEIKLWLMGDGTFGNPGIMIRLDRLEQSEENRKDETKEKRAWRWGLSASIIILFLERVFHYLKGLGGH